MREKGYSYSEIAKKIEVSKSSAFLWTKDVRLDQRAKAKIIQRRIFGKEKASRRLHLRAEQRLEKSRKWSENLVKNNFLSTKFDKVVICSLLYWGEGVKTGNRVEFTNSDPDMIRLFIKTLCNGFGVKKSQMKANMHLHEYHDEEKQLKYWIKVTGLLKKNFNKTYWKQNSGKNIRQGYPGCVRICFYSKETVDKIKSVYKELLKYV